MSTFRKYKSRADTGSIVKDFQIFINHLIFGSASTDLPHAYILDVFHVLVRVLFSGPKTCSSAEKRQDNTNSKRYRIKNVLF